MISSFDEKETKKLWELNNEWLLCSGEGWQMLNGSSWLYTIKVGNSDELCL